MNIFETGKVGIHMRDITPICNLRQVEIRLSISAHSDNHDEQLRRVRIRQLTVSAGSNRY